MQLLLLLLLLSADISAQDVVRAQKCGFANGTAFVTQITRNGDRDIPQFDESLLDESMVSPSGNFRIHFTRSGSHAVADPDPGNWPPFVLATAQSADSVYHVITEKLGFLPPLSDDDLDGPELDIYIRNWFGTYYGMTYFDSYVDQSEYLGYPAYLVLDNDYVEVNYATRGLQALQVTIAHEFFHMVQLRYAHPGEFNWSNLNWYEISSVWMEEVCYPDIDDYHAYVEDNFQQINFPNLDGPSGYSYGHGLFAQVLDIEYGTRNGTHVMLDLWEHLHGNQAFENLGLILSQAPWNSSLTDALGKYALYNIFTGSRAIPGEYYPDAAELPEIRTGLYPLVGEVIDPMPFNLQTLQIQYRKFTVSALSNVLVRGTDLTQKQRVYLTQDSEGTHLLKGAILNYWIPCNGVTSQDYLIVALANGDLEETLLMTLEFELGSVPLEDIIQALWPNPVSLGQDPLNLNLIFTKAGPLIITIYNILGQQVWQTEGQNPVEGVFELQLDLPPGLDAGLYILQVRAGAVRLNRKFTVLK